MVLASETILPILHRMCVLQVADLMLPLHIAHKSVGTTSYAGALEQPYGTTAESQQGTMTSLSSALGCVLTCQSF